MEVNISTKLKFGNILFGCLRQVGCLIEVTANSGLTVSFTLILLLMQHCTVRFAVVQLHYKMLGCNTVPCTYSAHKKSRNRVTETVQFLECCYSIQICVIIKQNNDVNDFYIMLNCT